MPARPRLFYGWVIVAASFCIYTAASGPGIAFGVFIKPMAQELHWTRAAITGALGIYLVVMGVFSVAAGILVDRVGPRLTNLLGGSCLGLGLVLASRVHEIWQLYLGFALLCGMGFAFVYLPLTATISRWFVERKGLALGLLYSGAGIGGLVMSPLAGMWIRTHGWRATFVILGVLVWAVALPAGLLLRKEPTAMGLRPLGGSAGPRQGDRAPGSAEDLTDGRQHTLAEAIRMGSFWIYNLVYVLLFTGVMMAQVNMVPHATDRGIPEATAALALGLAAAANAAGRVGLGAISDRIGTRGALGTCLLLAAASLFWLVAAREPWMLMLFAVPFGIAYGGSLPQGPRVIEDLFGARSMGAILGAAAPLGIVGPALGPVLGAAIYDRTGSYDLGFLIGGCSILAAFGLFLLLDLPQRKAG